MKTELQRALIEMVKLIAPPDTPVIVSVSNRKEPRLPRKIKKKMLQQNAKINQGKLKFYG